MHRTVVRVPRFASFLLRFHLFILFRFYFFFVVYFVWFFFFSFICFYFFHGVCVVVHRIVVHIVKIGLWFGSDLLHVML